jgi:hypothetical protein
MVVLKKVLRQLFLLAAKPQGLEQAAEKGCGKRFLGRLGHGDGFNEIVQNCTNVAARKFPGAGNFAGNFSVVRPENLRLCPKCAKSALKAGNEQGIQGISPHSTEELGVTCCFW